MQNYTGFKGKGFKGSVKAAYLRCRNPRVIRGSKDFNRIRSAGKVS